MTKDQFENYINRFPIYQYRFLSTSELMFSEKSRQICKKNCPHYKTSWSCPPAVGKVEECKLMLQEFPDVLLISWIANMKNPLSSKDAYETRQKPEENTMDIEQWLNGQEIPYFTLTSDVCRLCDKCGYPKIPCRNPDWMHPCIEGYGIMLSETLQNVHMDYDLGEHYIFWYALIFFNAEKTPQDRLEELAMDRILAGKIEDLSILGAEINEDLILGAEREGFDEYN